MTATIVVMIIIGIIFIFVSYFISEKIASESQSKNEDLLTVDENYKFSDRELQIIKTKIEDVIKPLLYYFAAIFIVLLLVTYIPAISLWLPGLLGYVK